VLVANPKRNRSRLSRGAAALCIAAAVIAVPAEATVRSTPVVGGVKVTATATAVAFTFRTSFPAHSSVELGTDDTYGLRLREEGAPSTSHGLVVRGLRPGTEYRYRVFAAVGSPASELALFRTEPIRPPLAADTVGRVITVDGDPFFPVLGWAQCADDVDENLSIGVNVFMGYSPCGPQAEEDLVESATGRALTVMPIGSVLGSLGWHQMDEPDGYGVPPSDLPFPPDRAKTGKVTFLTVTAHFSPLDAPLPLGKDVYPEYFARADVVGFDYYTFGKACGKPYAGLAYTFDEHRELMKLTGKPTFQWIETGPLEGYCLGPDWPQLTPERLAAEVWLAIAAGATGLGFFTHTWHTGMWERFDVAPAIADEITRQNARIATLQPALLAEQVPVRMKARSPVKVGARRYGGSLYLVAVNATEQPVTATFRAKGLAAGSRLAVWREGRTVTVRRTGVTDRFGPLEVHIYRSS